MLIDLKISIVKNIHTTQSTDSVQSLSKYQWNFIDLKHTIKSVWIHERSWIVKAILRKKNKTEGIVLPGFKLYYKVLVIKIVLTHTHKKNRHTDQCKWRAYAATAAKSLQSCPTLCDPIDSSPPGSVVPGILQARTLEWVAISFSNAWSEKWKGSRSVVSDS